MRGLQKDPESPQEKKSHWHPDVPSGPTSFLFPAHWGALGDRHRRRDRASTYSSAKNWWPREGTPLHNNFKAA